MLLLMAEGIGGLRVGGEEPAAKVGRVGAEVPGVSALVSDRWVLCAGVDHRFDPTVRRSGVVFGDEPSPVGGTGRVDLESQLVDGDMMVIPQCSLTRRADCLHVAG